RGMRSLGVVPLGLLIAACAGAAEAPGADAVALLARVDSIDSLARHSPERERAFFIAGGRVALAPGTAAWPPEAEAEVRVLYTHDGRPLRHVEVPVSESGDWYAEHAHYFDSTGRTVATRGYVGYLVDECGGSGSVTRRTAYGPGLRVLLTDTLYTDAAGAVRDSVACGGGRADLLSGTPRESYAALVQAG